MFISITFSVADFRDLYQGNAGRLERPSWGSFDPRAAFARGFGPIHTRTKSGNGFAGENYYADCDNLIRYPSKFFLTPLVDSLRRVLAYPLYRRFYYDGQMAGRFELGFRLNKATIDDIKGKNPSVEYNVSVVAQQMLESNLEVQLLDGRKPSMPLLNASDALRDGWLLSSTKTKELRMYDIHGIGSKYVGVSAPFVFIRTSNDTPISTLKRIRILINTNDLHLFLAHSGKDRQNFDTVVITSNAPIDGETAKERLARLFYTQIRTLAYAHSFYVEQTTKREIIGTKSLEPAVSSLLERLANLAPLKDDEHDHLTCEELKRILKNTDIEPSRLAREIEKQILPGWWRRHFGKFLGYFDRKADIAIEAAASTATKHLFSGGL